jgi:hypothetical protein
MSLIPGNLGTELAAILGKISVLLKGIESWNPSVEAAHVKKRQTTTNGIESR